MRTEMFLGEQVGSLKPREIEDLVAREVLGWVFVRADEPGYSDGPGWYKPLKDGSFEFVGWPDRWATDMDAMWALAGTLAKEGLDWQISTRKGERFGSYVKLLGPTGSAEAESGPDQMPLAMCLALLNMAEAKKAHGSEKV